MQSELSTTEKQTAEQEIDWAYSRIKKFLEDHDLAKRGGIHDFMEVIIANMIQDAISSINKYLQSGHHKVDANEIMAIAVGSFQKILDEVKRNLDGTKRVNFTRF